MASPEFLKHIKSLYPSTSLPVDNPWAMVAAVAFSASNAPEAIPALIKCALEDVESEEDKKIILRKIKDGLFKSGLLTGFPKAINALTAIHEALPESLREKEPVRHLNQSTTELADLGQAHFSRTYGETTDNVQTFLKEISPDFEYFSTTFAYGYVYSQCAATSALETSFSIAVANIAGDTPKQAAWHLQGCIRNGATVSEVQAVRQIAIEVATEMGLVFKNEVPELEI